MLSLYTSDLSTAEFRSAYALKYPFTNEVTYWGHGATSFTRLILKSFIL